MKLVAPRAKKLSVHQNAQDSYSETENIPLARTSTPEKQTRLPPKQLQKIVVTFCSNKHIFL